MTGKDSVSLFYSSSRPCSVTKGCTQVPFTCPSSLTLMHWIAVQRKLLTTFCLYWLLSLYAAKFPTGDPVSKWICRPAERDDQLTGRILVRSHQRLPHLRVRAGHAALAVQLFLWSASLSFSFLLTLFHTLLILFFLFFSFETQTVLKPHRDWRAVACLCVLALVHLVLKL